MQEGHNRNIPQPYSLQGGKSGDMGDMWSLHSPKDTKNRYDLSANTCSSHKRRHNLSRWKNQSRESIFQKVLISKKIKVE